MFLLVVMESDWVWDRGSTVTMPIHLSAWKALRPDQMCTADPPVDACRCNAAMFAAPETNREAWERDM